MPRVQRVRAGDAENNIGANPRVDGTFSYS
jgi:hypothetical protein